MIFLIENVLILNDKKIDFIVARNVLPMSRIRMKSLEGRKRFLKKDQF